MVNAPNSVLIGRTNYDTATQILSNQVAQPMIDYAHERIYNITILDGATRHGLEGAILQHQPEVCMFFTHGREDALAGQDQIYDLLSLTNALWMNNRIVYNCACLSGKELAPALIDNGARAVFAFTDVLTVLAYEREGFPLLEGFKECLTKPQVIFDGKTVQEAWQETIEEYNKWIDYWDEKDPAVADVLRHDRDNFKLFGDGNARISFSWYVLIGSTEVVMYVWMALASILKIIKLYKWWKGG